MKSAEERKESRGVSVKEIDIIEFKYARQIHHPLYSTCHVNLYQRRADVAGEGKACLRGRPPRKHGQRQNYCQALEGVDAATETIGNYDIFHMPGEGGGERKNPAF